MKHFFAFLFLLCSFSLLNAQEWQWAQSSGDYNAKTFSKFCKTDNEGNVYVAGEFSSESLIFDSKTIQNKGRNEIYIVKYNSEGTVLWAKSFGGSNDDYIYELTIASDNSVFICGSYASSDFSVSQQTFPFGGGIDGFYVNLDADGQYINHFTLSDSENQTIKSIKTQNGSVIIGGEFSSKELTIGNHVLENKTEGLNDFFVAKENQGTWQWANSNGGSNTDNFTQLIVDEDGNIYTAQTFADSLVFNGTKIYSANTTWGDNMYFNQSMLCLKYDADGNEVEFYQGNEVNEYQNNGIVTLRGIYLNSNKQINITYQVMPMISIGKAYPTYALIGLDYDFNEIQYFSTYSVISDIGYDEKGNIYLSNYSNSHFADISIIKLDPEYTIIGQKTITAPNDDIVNGIAVTGEDQFYIAGSHSSNTLDFGSTKLPNTNYEEEVYFHLVGVFKIPYKNMFVAKSGDTFSWDTPSLVLTKADFTYEKTGERTFQFTNTSSGITEGQQWDFGDGTTSAGEDPLHEFTADGIYNVCLYIDEKGNNLFPYKACKEVVVGDVSLESQTIELKEGWNLFSTNIMANSPEVDKIFAPILSEVIVIKNDDAFFSPDIPVDLNSLKEIDGGNGYLIKMKSGQSLTITGKEVDLSNFSLSLKTGWNIVGIPFQESADIETALSPFMSEIEIIKHFQGFYEQGSDMNSLSDLEPGKAYFIKVKSDITISF